MSAPSPNPDGSRRLRQRWHQHWRQRRYQHRRGRRTRPDPLPRMYRGYRLQWTRLRHLDRIARLERRLFPEPLSPGRLVILYLTPSTRYLCALRGREVAGYIGFHLWGPMAHTISMAVHPDHRRRGLGRALQRAADRVAAGSGARWFMGEVRASNHAQLQMLESLGWQRVGLCPRFFGNGEDAVVMWNLLRLSPSGPASPRR